jgi:bifunctional DNA-binding transcriptional regulator/antitoxin component of YhaV-PrlF toxin-antitoxin module
MAKVTGKFQITLPKVVVDECGIRVGDDLTLRPVGGSIHVERRAAAADGRREDRLAHFDQATARQKSRRADRSGQAARSRGWTRKDLYVRGRAR